MKWITQCFVSRSVVIGMFIFGMLSACAGNPPLEQRYTAGQLRKMLTEPIPKCVKEQCELNKDGSIRCWLYEPYMGKFVQPEECLDEYRKWKTRIADRRTALERRYNVDAATAPACTRERAVSRTFFEMAEVNPDATDVMAQALARGAFVPFEDPQCMAQICQWRTQVEPSEHSPYCTLASHNLAAGSGWRQNPTK